MADIGLLLHTVFGAPICFKTSAKRSQEIRKLFGFCAAYNGAVTPFSMYETCFAQMSDVAFYGGTGYFKLQTEAAKGEPFASCIDKGPNNRITRFIR